MDITYVSRARDCFKLYNLSALNIESLIFQEDFETNTWYGISDIISMGLAFYKIISGCVSYQWFKKDMLRYQNEFLTKIIYKLQRCRLGEIVLMIKNQYCSNYDLRHNPVKCMATHHIKGLLLYKIF